MSQKNIIFESKIETHENSVLDVLSLEVEAELEGSEDVLGPLERDERLLGEVGLRDGDLLFAVVAFKQETVKIFKGAQ